MLPVPKARNTDNILNYRSGFWKYYDESIRMKFIKGRCKFRH